MEGRPIQEQIHPTFYLGGQPYELTPESPTMPDELVEKALEDTRRAFWRLRAAYLGHQPLPEEGGRVLTAQEWSNRAIELMAGISCLLYTASPHIKRVAGIIFAMLSGGM